MRLVLPLSILFGLAWNTIVLLLMGARGRELVSPSWLVAGVIAGVVAGMFTVASRRQTHGDESFKAGVAGYYLAMLVYWAAFVVIERVLMCVRHGGWTDFDLRDHLMLGANFLLYGTVVYGIGLIPLSFLARNCVWSVYRRSSG